MLIRSWLLSLALAFLLGIGFSPQTAFAFEVDKPLADPAQEERALDLHKALRCLVCQNQSISDSDAPLAKDLRILVRERVAAGDNDDEVLDFLTARYGDWVLLSPPVKPRTWALWLAPLVLLGLGIVGFRLWYRRPQTAANAPLNEKEQERVRALLDDSGTSL